MTKGKLKYHVSNSDDNGLTWHSDKYVSWDTEQQARTSASCAIAFGSCTMTRVTHGRKVIAIFRLDPTE